MTIENNTPEPAKQMIENPFGTRLKMAREAMGLDSKDAAARLRLNERIILMMEADTYPSDLPATFVRGYIRSYAKLLQIPENEIQTAIAPIKSVEAPISQTPVTIQQMPLNSSNYLVQTITYGVALTLIGLAGLWWHTHNTNLKKNDVLMVTAEPLAETKASETGTPTVIAPVVTAPASGTPTEPALTETPRTPLTPQKPADSTETKNVPKYLQSNDAPNAAPDAQSNDAPREETARPEPSDTVYSE